MEIRLVGRRAADWITVCKKRRFKALPESRLGFCVARRLVI